MKVLRITSILLASIFVLTMALSSPLDGAPGDWPQWRGPERTAVSAETGLLKEWPKEGPKLLWQTKGIGGGFGSVAVVGDRIYCIGDAKGGQSVFCLDASKEGKQIWTTPIRKGGDGARSTPTVDGDLLFALAGKDQGEIVCLDAKEGKEKWRKDLNKDFGGKMMSGWGYSESPLVDGENVIVTPGGGDATIVCLDRKSGKVNWKSVVPGGDGAGYASVSITEGGGVRQYVQLLQKGLVGVSARDGKFLWRYDRIANGTANIPTPIVKDDMIFCSTGYNTGAALLKLVPQGKGGVKVEEKVWLKPNEFQNHHGGMLLVGDHIYAGSGHNNGSPICIEFKTGKVVWKEDRGAGSGSAAICAADGNVYFRYENAVVALVEATPKGYTLKGSFKIPNGSNPSWAHPVIAGGKLYLRDQERILCYDVKGK